MTVMRQTRALLPLLMHVATAFRLPVAVQRVAVHASLAACLACSGGSVRQPLSNFGAMPAVLANQASC